MRILFDQGTPVPLQRFLPGHQVETAYRMGWSALQNGDLIAAAEKQFDLIITTDKNWKYQQNTRLRTIAIVVLPTTNWRELEQIADRIIAAVTNAKPGDYVELPL